MMNPSYKGRALLPMPVIEAARAGDAGAVEQVLRYYEGYINKLHRAALRPAPVSSAADGVRLRVLRAAHSRASTGQR